MIFNLHPSPADHEELFIERYVRLLSAAERLTGGQRDRAEELVQEAFIQFTLTAPNLTEIRNLDAYLYGVIRKLYLSHARRAARAPEVPLSTVDYDSVEMGLRQVDARARQHVFAELAAVCAYACDRKSSSKAASVLILRFFHGYYPGEIAQILRIDVRAVDEWRRIARREARAALREERPFADFHSASISLADLRAAIFRSCTGPCLTSTQLSTYGRGTTRERFTTVVPFTAGVTRTKSDVDCATAAHIVSCERCLNDISRRLRIPTLAERSPEDNLGPGTRSDPPPPPPGHSGPSSNGLIRRARRRGKDTFEHRPEQLHIAVNGLPLVWQSIGMEPIDQHVNVTTHEPIELVEVFSEQGIRLLFLNALSPTEAAPVQRAQVHLSGDRAMTLALSFSGAWPSLHLTYCDPAGRAVVESADESKSESVIAADVRPPQDSSRLLIEAGRATARLWPRRRWAFAFGVLLVIAWFVLVSPSSALAMLERAARDVVTTLRDWLSRNPSAESPIGAVWQAPPVTPLPSAAPSKPAASGARSVPQPVPPSFAELAALEIDALDRLNRIGALLGERVTVTRERGRVRVRAIAETPVRKAEITAALAPLVGKPGIEVTATSATEHLTRRRSRATDATVFREVHVIRDAFPVWDAVERYLQQHDEPPHTDGLHERVRQFASRLLRRSGETLAHAWAVQRLVGRFTREEQEALPGDASETWRTLVGLHARAIRDSTTAIRTELENVFEMTFSKESTPAASERDEPASLPSTNSVHRLVSLVSSYDEAIRAAFTAQDDAATRRGEVTSIDPALVQSMREAERLADRLSQPTRP